MWGMPLRRGNASVLAMLYLVLFGALALGFYAATSISTDIVQNEQHGSRALLAAESGMEFIRYHLMNVRVPPGTAQDQVLNQVYSELSRLLIDTPNLGCRTVGFDGTTISIPAAADQYIAADDEGSRFRATIHVRDGKLAVQATGRFTRDTISRAVLMDYGRTARTGIFNYAVASKGRIVTGGSSRVTASPDPSIANFLSAAPNDPTPVIIGGKEIGGDVSITNALANVTYQSGSVGGSSDVDIIRSQHIFRGVPEPEFPTVDCAMFRRFATNVYSASGGKKGGGSTYSNIYIPPNSNVKFNAKDVLEGIIYIGAGSTVTFNGGCTIRGMIVVEQNPNVPVTDTRLDFQGNVEAYGVETLDPATYGELRQYTGSFILAPTATIDCQGNFGTIVTGSIIGGSIKIHGSAGGTLRGSIIGMNPAYPLELSNANSSPITFLGIARDNPPAGTGFSSFFLPDSQTYEEVAP